MLGVIAAMFLVRAHHRAYLYDDGYVVVAFAIALLPTLLAAGLLIELGRRRAGGAAADGLTIASLVGFVVAVPAGLVATTMLGVS
jgi:hypothetical protein